MDKSPLVNEQIAAGENLIREFNKRFRVGAAFWLRELDADEWYLYLASDDVSDSNIDEAYRNVLQIVPPRQNLWIDPFQVKVVGMNSSVARAALTVMKQHGAQIATRYRGREFGDFGVDEAYIYPQPLTVSA